MVNLQHWSSNTYTTPCRLTKLSEHGQAWVTGWSCRTGSVSKQGEHTVSFLYSGSRACGVISDMSSTEPLKTAFGPWAGVLLLPHCCCRCRPANQAALLPVLLPSVLLLPDSAIVNNCSQYSIPCYDAYCARPQAAFEPSTTGNPMTTAKERIDPRLLIYVLVLLGSINPHSGCLLKIFL